MEIKLSAVENEHTVDNTREKILKSLITNENNAAHIFLSPGEGNDGKNVAKPSSGRCVG